MSNLLLLNVADVVGSSFCVSSTDGQILHDRIAEALRDEQPVRISFKEVDTVISAFLNTAIGQLYSEFPEERVKRNLSVQDMPPEDLNLLKRVVDNAKVYFANKENFDSAWKEEVGDEE